ncbi:MAG: 2-hydroxycyclohexanecarboxyl-CoA dehydrogenase [Actinomycetia bacterium]|jgi:NAD(P)-dependent dehydrogenase (short-subunit alcohol dehydrogenase family)|nr:2-hydroxycyclohexanecarboxyl-CoA dehydrogenase [Actinomycetes bacterium]
MTQQLQNKNAIIYGGSGSIGGASARAFAREGATVFLAGRTLKTLEAVAEDIKAAGGSAHVAELDALDESAVNEHAAAVAAQAGSIDVSLNLVSRGDRHGVTLVDMTAEDFARPVTTGLMSNFNTARAAARHMAEQGSGVILTLTSASSRGTAPTLGSTGVADAATETFLRYLAAENGPQGVRVVGLWAAGIPETFDPPLPPEVSQRMAEMTMLHRMQSLTQVVDSFVFLASDRAAGITGTILNVTCGLVSG